MTRLLNKKEWIDLPKYLKNFKNYKLNKRSNKMEMIEKKVKYQTMAYHRL